jgi:GNAT superfamily N-acetyltransferase
MDKHNVKVCNTEPFAIRIASTADTTSLSELTYHSKAHWGYSAKQMNEWREELTITKDYINTNAVYLLEQGDQVLGYYSYCLLEADKVHLDNLFVDPKHLGKGIGSKLLLDFFDRIHDSGVSRIILHADPHAEGFYLKYGLATTGQKESSIAGRFLPIMEMIIP